MQLRWGIVGTGRICQDFCQALLTCDAREHAIVAVGSRSKEQVDKFVREFALGDAVRTYGSQEEVLQDANVDIVYIGTIEQVHRDLCLKAFALDKHVLCEKPLAMNEAETREIIEAAKRSKKFMMEAIWSRFFPIYDHLREAVKQVGKVNPSDDGWLVANRRVIPGHSGRMHVLHSQSDGSWRVEYIDVHRMLSSASSSDCFRSRGTGIGRCDRSHAELPGRTNGYYGEHYTAFLEQSHGRAHLFR